MASVDRGADGTYAYRCGDRIGGMHEVVDRFAGGLGVVYVCRRHGGDGRFVLKTFQDRFLRRDSVREAFQREAVTNVRLGWHPHTVTANHAVILDGRPFIDMLYVPPDAEGRRTLTDHLPLRRPLPLDRTCRIAIQICHGMEHAVAQGVTPHQDLKPDNVLISDGAFAKVADFGLARAIEADLSACDADETTPTLEPVAPTTRRHRVRAGGTPPWMSPEHFDGRTDERSDIYALGIMLFQMVSGRYPYRSRDWEYAHKEESVPVVDSPLAAIMYRALAKDPLARYQEFAALRRDLEAVFQEATGQAYPSLSQELQAMGFERNPLGGWGEKGSVNHSVSLATTLHNLGRDEEAELLLKRALQINSAAPAVHAILGLVLRRRGAIDEALTCLQRASEDSRADPLQLHNTATTLMMAGRCEEALPLFDRAIALDGPLPMFLADKALCLEELGQHEPALSIVDRVLTQSPRDPKAWLLKARILIALQHGPRALHALDEAYRFAATTDIAQAYHRLRQQALALSPAQPADSRAELPWSRAPNVTTLEFPFTIPISSLRHRQLHALLHNPTRPSKSITSAELAAVVRADTGVVLPAWAHDREFEQELEALLQTDIVWICPDCDAIVAFFEVPPGEDLGPFVRDLLLVHRREHVRCPTCAGEAATLFSPGVLTYGEKVSIARALGSQPHEPA